VIVDSTKRLVVGSFPQGPVLPKDWPRLRILDPRFVYDRASKDLFLVGEDAVALDKGNHPLGFVSGTEVAKAAGFDMTPVHVPGIQETLPPRYSLEGLVVVPDHKLVLLLKNGKTPTLVLWDRNNKTALATWKETQTYINTDTRTLRPGEKSRQDPLSCGEPLVSRDGSKLFVESKGGDKTGLLIFEAGTLKLLRRLALPESSGPEGMLRAPDSRGIWYVGESGKVYRLDENTGDVVEQVKLPFHLLSVIREP
jgi:outer membrane protein assembly factor BamB